MYKKLLFLVAVFVFAVGLSGCTKYSTTFEITKKDEVILTQQCAINLDLYKKIDNEYDLNNPYKNWNKLFNKKIEERYQNKGFVVKDIIDDKYIGKEFQKKFKHAKFFFSDSLPPGYSIATDSDLPVVITKAPFKTFYSIHLNFDPQKLRDASEETYNWHGLLRISALKSKQTNSTSQNVSNNIRNQDNAAETNKNKLANSSEEDVFAITPVADLTIKIPMKATNHNATRVDPSSNTYTWKISETNEYKNKQNVDIVLEYEVVNYINIAILSLILLVTLVIIIANRKSDKTQNDETERAF